jgi:hypothetical protein
VAELSIADFNAKWEKSQQEPTAKMAAVKKVDLPISASDILDGLQRLADNALGQGTLKKSDHDELVSHLGNLRTTLQRIGEPVLLKAAPPPSTK